MPYHFDHALYLYSVLFIGSISISMCSAQQPEGENRETQALNNACKAYLHLKDDKVPPEKWSEEDATSVGFCMGYFRGFMAASADVLLGPDQEGRIMEFKIAEGTTYVQAIRVFLITTQKEPAMLKEDAGMVIMAVLKLSGLASYQEKKELHVKN